MNNANTSAKSLQIFGTYFEAEAVAQKMLPVGEGAQGQFLYHNTFRDADGIVYQRFCRKDENGNITAATFYVVEDMK